VRSYLVIFIVLGVVSSILSHAPSRPSASPAVPDANAPADLDNTSEISSTKPQPLDGTVELRRNADGHFYADVDVNGTSIHMLVDTGATGIALSREDARKAAIATSIGMPNVIGQGADGTVHGEYVTIDRITLGQKTAERVPAMVLNSGEQSLLGQDFLRKFASVDIHDDTMTLR
jgi:aspartyl protease family protein